MLWEAFSPERFPQPRIEMLMKAMTVGAITGNPRRNKYLIPVTILAAVILIGFLADRSQLKPGAAVIARELTTISQSVLEEKYGLRVNLVAVTAAGGLVDVRLKVTDAEKAKQLLKDAASYPALMVSGSDASLAVPKESRAQELKPENGGMIMLLFPNTRNAVKPGAEVAILFGDIRLEPVVAK
jgi:hypothetical protein